MTPPQISTSWLSNQTSFPFPLVSSSVTDRVRNPRLGLTDLTDNTGAYADLVHPDTIKDVSTHFPRLHWSNCFAATIHRENGLKPWANTTALGEEEFPAKVLGNKLMEPYE
jgi:hypothetical protein